MSHVIISLEERRKKRKKSVNWGGLMLALALVFVFAAVATGAGGQGVAEKLHPALQELARAQPEQTVAVIVQKAGQADAEALVPALGGVVTKDLRIINAFAAELPAGAVPALVREGGVRWVSPDGPVERAAPPPKGDTGGPECGYDYSTGDLGPNCFPGTLNLQQVWDMGLDGSGIGVAIIDSGVSPDRDFTDIAKSVSFNPNSNSVTDVSGHGTHVAGIVAGNGQDSAGLYKGLAPGVTLISLKVSDETGMAYESDTVAAMQWVLENKDQYNIRVVNLSINAATEMSYHVSPLDAAAEILWFNKIVVVASAGNRSLSDWNTIDAAPANDPFIITVGATYEANTFDWRDDMLALYSSYGTTMDGFFKPEIIAPGHNVVSVLSKQSQWQTQHPERVVANGEYFRISGTSMSAPMVAGTAALMLQQEPGLNPDQVKYRLMNAGSRSIDWTIGKGKSALKYSVPYLDVYAAVTAGTTGTANTGTPASQLLWTGSDPVNWGSVNWASVNWASVNWASVNWASVNWASVNWASVDWSE